MGEVPERRSGKSSVRRIRFVLLLHPDSRFTGSGRIFYFVNLVSGRPLFIVIIVTAAATATGRIAPGDGVAGVTRRTRASGDVIFGVADGVSAALAAAHWPALVIQTDLVVTTLLIHLALSSTTSGQRVTDVSGLTGAHGPLFACVVVSGSAFGIGSARIRFAKVSCNETLFSLKIWPKNWVFGGICKQGCAVDKFRLRLRKMREPERRLATGLKIRLQL